MKSTRPFLAATLLLLILALQSFAQTVAMLPRSTPEAEGISSESIYSFLNAISNSKHEFHSFMMVRHGKVVAEAWWAPYRPDLRHTLYSCSKSFTATAVGFAVTEGKIALTDKVVSFFPEHLPKEISPNLAALNIRDLLTMTVGQDPDPSFSLAVTDSNWIAGFLKTPIIDKPGTKFLYNSLGTYMAGAIVQKVSGQSLIEYLQPRLFEPLGIVGADWEKDLMGYNVGGWGLRLKTEDMAKFAQLFLQKGKWNGRQVLPEAWVEEATTLKILQSPDMPQADRDKTDWAQGYCYQMWRSRHNSYRGDGAYGQYMLVLPEQDAVIAITSETADMQGELDLVWKHLLPGFHEKPLPEGDAARNLKKKLSSLNLPVLRGPATSQLVTNWTGKTFTFEGNQYFKNVSFQVEGSTCKMLLTTDNAEYPLLFGYDQWQEGTTEKLGPYLSKGIKGYFKGLPPSKVSGSYAWLDSQTLQFKLRYIESPHSETFTCKFLGDHLLLKHEESNRFGEGSILLEGWVR